MQTKEVTAKSILNKSGLSDYCVNPYAGCGFGCRYCYAQLIMRRFYPGIQWGEYAYPKVNAAEILAKELKRAKKGSVFISSVTDAYQPLEKKYELTRKCLSLLLEKQFPVTVQTKSPLVLRDLDLLKKFNECTVGMTVTTDDDEIRKKFEPKAPPIASRVDALRQLHEAGIRTYAFIGPMLPMNAKSLAAMISMVDFAYIDRMNYNFQVKKLCEELGMDDAFYENAKKEIASELNKMKIECKVIF